MAVDSNGVGFGNLSVRDGVSRTFYITGSATGSLPELTPTDCVRIVAYDFAKNSLRYEGIAVPSSESLTHAAIYESDSSISAVIHCHDSDLWQPFWIAYRQLRSPLLTVRRKWRTKSFVCSRKAMCDAERFSSCWSPRRRSEFREKSSRGTWCPDSRIRLISQESKN